MTVEPSFTEAETAAMQRALEAALELGRAIARGQTWDRDDAVVPWHANASSFEALPARVAEAILGEWGDAGGCLGGIVGVGLGRVG